MASYVTSFVSDMLFLRPKLFAQLKATPSLLNRGPTHNKSTFSIYRALATMATEPSKYKLNHSM